LKKPAVPLLSDSQLALRLVNGLVPEPDHPARHGQAMLPDHDLHYPERPNHQPVRFPPARGAESTGATRAVAATSRGFAAGDTPAAACSEM